MLFSWLSYSGRPILAVPAPGCLVLEADSRLGCPFLDVLSRQYTVLAVLSRHSFPVCSILAVLSCSPVITVLSVTSLKSFSIYRTTRRRLRFMNIYIYIFFLRRYNFRKKFVADCRLPEMYNKNVSCHTAKSIFCRESIWLKRANYFPVYCAVLYTTDTVV